FARFGLAFNQTVRVANWRRHQHVGFIAGVAEHQALVAGTLIFRPLAIYTLGDIDRLLADDIEYASGGAVETDVGRGVADIANDLAHDFFQIGPRRGGDLASDDGNAGFYQCLARHARVLILGDQAVEHGVGNLVGDLIGMAFGNGFGSENGIVGHRVTSPDLEC